jgi:periplasmic protein TonB
VVIMGARANEGWKRRSERLYWQGVVLSVALHFAVLGLWPAMSAADIRGAREEFFVIPPPPVDLPPPPDKIAQPALPVVSSAVIDDQITIPPSTFEAHPRGRLPAGPSAAPAAEAGNFTHFVPSMEAPRVLNVQEVERALQRNYPTLLRDAGIGGTVEVLLWLQADGSIHRAALGRTSGHADLDAAALRVVEVMRLSPARNRATAVAVMVSIPVVFQAR